MSSKKESAHNAGQAQDGTQPDSRGEMLRLQRQQTGLNDANARLLQKCHCIFGQGICGKVVVFGRLLHKNIPDRSPDNAVWNGKRGGWARERGGE